MPKLHKNTSAERGRLAGKQKRYIHDRKKLYPQNLDLTDREPEYVEAYSQAYHKKTSVDKSTKTLKISTCVYCCAELLGQAKELGINRSEVFESAIKSAIEQNTHN